MSPRDFERGSDFYRRRGPVQKPRKTFLIVTEGQESEPNYFNALKARLLLTNLEVRVHHPEGTDPKTLTDEAIQLAEQRRREAKRDDGVPYDEVWVVTTWRSLTTNGGDYTRASRAAAIRAPMWTSW